MSFLAALMNAAQLGLEVNSALGEAFLIPYKNKGNLECQFQIGYKGLIDLAYRNGQMQTIQAQSVYENDEFCYEYGLEPKLIHRPAPSDRGELVYFYGIFRTVNGGFGFSVMSKNDMDNYAKRYSKAYDSSYSPWKTDYEAMAKKTVIKQALKYAGEADSNGNANLQDMFDELFEKLVQVQKGADVSTVKLDEGTLKSMSEASKESADIMTKAYKSETKKYVDAVQQEKRKGK